MLEANTVLIKENALPIEYQNTIEAFVKDTHFPWFLQDNISGVDGAFNDPRFVPSTGFTHMLFKDDEIKSNFFLHDINFENIIIKLAKSFNVNLEDILRAKLNLTTPIFNYTSENFCAPHRDLFIPHWVFLYYINDSDGDTVLFETNTDPYDPNLKIAHRVTPKKGKCILFDGTIYHTQSNPIQTPNRINLNVDVKLCTH